MKMNIKNLLNACVGAYNDTEVTIYGLDFDIYWIGKMEMMPKGFENSDVLQFSVHQNNTIDIFIK